VLELARITSGRGRKSKGVGVISARVEAIDFRTWFVFSRGLAQPPAVEVLFSAPSARDMVIGKE
jgi:hypothetical protein